MIPLNHVEPHRPRVLDDPEVHRPQALELVDVVAVGVGETAVGLAVRAALEPHHLRLGAVAKVQPVVIGLELVVDPAQVPAAVRGEERARFLALLAVAEQRAPQARHPLVPRELAEGLRLGDPDQLLVLRTVAEVLAVAVEEEVDGRAVHELEAPLGDALPVIGGNALAADASGDRNELQVQVVDAEPVDHLAHLADLLRPSGRFHEPFDVHRHSLALLARCRSCRRPSPPGGGWMDRAPCERPGSIGRPGSRGGMAVYPPPRPGDGLFSSADHDQFKTKTQPKSRFWYQSHRMTGTLDSSTDSGRRRVSGRADSRRRGSRQAGSGPAVPRPPARFDRAPGGPAGPDGVDASPRRDDDHLRACFTDSRRLREGSGEFLGVDGHPRNSPGFSGRGVGTPRKCGNMRDVSTGPDRTEKAVKHAR